MKRNEMEDVLNSTTVKDMPYVFIPSYCRPKFVDKMKWLKLLNEEALNKVFIVVREKQYRKYRKENPWLQYVVIPEGEVDGVGSTRQFIMDYAIKNRLSCIMDMDHDIKYLQFIYSDYTSKGDECSKHTGVKDWNNDPMIPQKVLQLAGKISKEVFKKYPKVILGNIRKQRFSNHPEYAKTKYLINKGPTPRQTKIINMKSVYKYGLKMPKEFNLHGDDIGFAAEVLQNGYSCFNIPCLCYDYIDDQIDSVVRDPHNPDKNRWLHKLEYDALQNMEIKHYLKETFKFPDGQYKFGDVDWRKYHKLHGTKSIVERWKT